MEHGCTGRASRRLAGLLGLAACAACVALLTAGPGSAEARAASQKLTLYSVAEQEQFVNNEDDRARGEGQSPFGNFSDVTPIVAPVKGPFPGDEALFSFNIYKTTALNARAGSAIFTCQYNFGANAFCDVSFQLNNGGTLIADGAFNFDAANFTLAITGGYGTYSNVSTGLVEVSPSAHHAQQLVFRLS
jgi:hypothetical protein